MTQIAHVRTFDGTDDTIQLDPADYNGAAIGAQTFAAIIYKNGEAGFDCMVGTAGGAGGEWAFETNGDDLSLWFAPNQQALNISQVPVSTWCLVAITRADGNSTPRFHRFRYDTSNWSHQDGSGALTETATLSGATLWIGTFDGASDFFEGRIACVGVFPSALSDGTLEGMTADIASWEAASPTGLWLLNQTSTSDPVLDRVGAGDQTAINGTTVTAEAGLAFDVGDVEPAAQTFKRLYGPTQLSTSAADLYTAPADTTTRLLHVHASNPSGSSVNVTLSIGADASATRVWDDQPVPADSFTDDFTDYTLAAGEKIQGWADTATTVTLTITGIEET